MESCSKSLIVPKLAFDTLTEAGNLYKENNSFSDSSLQSLHALFGESFIKAAELLESARFIQYENPSGCRKIIKILYKSEYYSIFPDINFCYCPVFSLNVLQTRSSLTCKHVLACKLAIILCKVKTETITDSQLADILNNNYETCLLCNA